MSWTVADTDRSIPERFEQQARLHPEKEAVAGAGWRPTFAELDAASNRLAAAVLERRGAPGGRAALLLRHDAPLMAAALGALKAGRTAVALNPGDPPARLDRIRADVEPEVVLTDACHRRLALRAGFAAEQLVLVPQRPDGSPHAPPGVAVRPDARAFLIYTSGSAGLPKAVMQTHRNVLHNVLRHTNGLGLSADDRISMLASLSGGQGLGIAWTALLNGATLCPFAIMERGVTGLAAWLEEQRVTVLVASASVFRTFVRTLGVERVPEVRLVRLASEPAVRADFEAYRRHFPDTCVLANTMSCSEVGNISRLLLSADAEVPEGRLPVGQPSEGIELLLLDERGLEVAPGEPGEIVVRSRYLSPGYWKDAALTDERFTAEDARGGARLYRTGDRGRLLDDGSLTVLGRSDSQVKVHGFRVELSEVETALVAHRDVAAAAVLATATARGDAKLTAYVTARAGRGLEPAALRAGLGATLSRHAVPTAFVVLDALPLTPHGKVDREQLARIEPPARLPARTPADMSEAEEVLATIWAEALDLERVGPEEDFLGLGGDSLSAAVVAAGIHAEFDVELELGAFAENPTVRTMADRVERLRGRHAAGKRPPLLTASECEPLPASFAQERVWRSSRSPAGRLGHTMAVAVQIRGPLDVEALRQSLDRVVGRHAVLRTTFAERDGQPVPVVHPPVPLDLPLVDLSAAPDAEARAREMLSRDAHQPFDLERGPLLRLTLIRIREDEHWLLRVGHHIISDGWSWKVFFRELSLFYEASRRGDPPPLPDRLPYQYGDFAAWQRRHLRAGEPRHREELGWWRRVFRDRHTPLTLPFARVAPPQHAVPSDGVMWWGLPPGASRELDLLGRSAGATYLVLRLAAFAAQLAIETGSEDIVVGTYVTNRRLRELQAMFGDFTNLATLRLRFAGNPSFREWLAHVRAVLLETSEHVDVPYAQVCRELEAEGIVPPEIRAVFGRSHRLPPLSFGGLEVTPLRSSLQVSPTGFTFLVDRSYEADHCHAYFDIGSYQPEGVRSFIERYKRLVASVAAHPDRPLRALLDEPADVAPAEATPGAAGDGQSR